MPRCCARARFLRKDAIIAIGAEQAEASPAAVASTLVCVIGSLRGSVAAWTTLLTNLLRPLSAHLALLVAYSERVPEVLHRHATHLWRVQEYARWDDLVDGLLGAGWRDGVQLPSNLWGGLHVAPGGELLAGSGAIIFALRLVLLAQLDALIDPPYSQVVLTRSDHYYACPHSAMRAGADEVLVPEGESWGGVSDRHTIFAFGLRHRVLRVLPWLAGCKNVSRTPPPQLCRTVNGRLACGDCTARASRFTDRREANPERALWWYFVAQGLQVRRFSRKFFTVAVEGDTTTWKAPAGTLHGLPLLGGQRAATLRCKYPDEFARAARTCHLLQTSCTVNVSQTQMALPDRGTRTGTRGDLRPV